MLWLDDHAALPLRLVMTRGIVFRTARHFGPFSIYSIHGVSIISFAPDGIAAQP